MTLKPVPFLGLNATVIPHATEDGEQLPGNNQIIDLGTELQKKPIEKTDKQYMDKTAAIEAFYKANGANIAATVGDAPVTTATVVPSNTRETVISKPIKQPITVEKSMPTQAITDVNSNNNDLVNHLNTLTNQLNYCCKLIENLSDDKTQPDDVIFRSLKIPNLEQEPKPPKFRVVFDLGYAGRYSASYHWVSKHGNGLFLIYDNRFKYGTQYSPPSFGDKQTIKVVLPELNQTYECYSMDFTHPFGCFDIVNLIIAEQVNEASNGRLSHADLADVTSVNVPKDEPEDIDWDWTPPIGLTDINRIR